MKKYIFLAASALTLASCTSDDFLGNTQGSTPTSANSTINFSGNAGKITRATSNEGTPQQMLDGQFLVYGVKKTNDEIFHNVFVNYSVWDVEANNTTSNTRGWEYVGAKDATDLGIGKITLSKEQTIKYWDYSASEYHFVAGSPIDAFKYNTSTDLTTGTVIKSATVSKLAGHIYANEKGTALETNPVYIAAPVKITKDDYQKPVTFTFQRQQSMVRVGLYETIPGYSITDIKFYAYDAKDNFNVSEGNNIILTSATPNYFVGGSEVSGTVTYNWDTPSYSFEYTENTNLKKSKNWYAGKLGTLAKTSSEQTVDILYGTDKDMSTTGYFTVLPTQATTASPILIKCDYTLISDDDSGETIKVTGATAAIPAAYSKWEANTRYTYLFKISDKTNGYTGTDPDKTGLYPITFDAVVKDEKQGTITTIATPSITTYQANSVVENSGIKYVTNKEIKVTVTDNTNGDIKTLSEDDSSVGYVAVYKLSQARTEADLQINNIKTSELTSTNSVDVSLAADNKSFTFTPKEEGYYAIQYLTTAAEKDKPAAYTYKVVYVAAATK
jgi:hypothetical protein